MGRRSLETRESWAADARGLFRRIQENFLKEGGRGP